MSKGVPNNAHNLNGRPKGSPNKVTKEVREAIAEACSGAIEEIPELLKKIIDPKEKIDALTKLLPYFAPKLQNIEFKENKEKEEPIRRMVWNKKST
jgi:hypothetical protein